MQFVTWLINHEAMAKIDFGKHCNSKWQASSSMITLKIEDTNGAKQRRVRSKSDQRAIEFGSQIENAENQHWTNVLDTKHDRNFVIHTFLAPEEEKEENAEANEEASDGIRNKKSLAATGASILHNQMGALKNSGS